MMAKGWCNLIRPIWISGNVLEEKNNFIADIHNTDFSYLFGYNTIDVCWRIYCNMSVKSARPK